LDETRQLSVNCTEDGVKIGQKASVVRKIVSRLPPSGVHDKVSNLQRGLPCRLRHEVALRRDALRSTEDIKVFKRLPNLSIRSIGRLENHLHFFAQCPSRDFDNSVLNGPLHSAHQAYFIRQLGLVRNDGSEAVKFVDSKIICDGLHVVSRGYGRKFAGMKGSAW
jgi:hypothetical protein